MLKWFSEHIKLTVVLAVAVALLIVTVVSFVHHGSSSGAGRAAESGAVKLQEPVEKAGNGLASIFGFLKYRSLMKENEEQQEQVAELQKQLRQQSLSSQDLEELRSLSGILNYEPQEETYEYLTADVVAMDGSLWFNIFTINRGSEDGLAKNDVVINGDGLVGKIYETGADWAKVISIIDQNNNISFHVTRDMNLLGILSGDGTGNLTGYLLDSNASVVEGDQLVTSGMELYPAGIAIGTVREVVWDADALVYMVTVEPSVYFKNLQKVTVLLPSGR